MSLRDNIERALIALDSLLEADSPDESLYQAWFEAHPIALQALGYGDVLPHPRILSAENTEWIPDFLVQAPNGTWEIFELKTPQASILMNLQRRAKFYSSFEGYVSQCREYARAFDDPRDRDDFETRYKVQVHKDLRSTIVAGRSHGLDARLVHEIATAKFPPITVLTYDDVRARLEQYRTYNFGDYERASGFGLIFVLVLREAPTPLLSNHIFDVGGSPEHDRISVFVNPKGYLRIELRDSDGRVHSARSVLPLEREDYGIPHVFVFSVGVGDGFGFLSIEIDRKYRADIRIEDFPFTVSTHYVLGSDITGAASSWMCVASLLVLNRPPTFHQKAVVQDWADKQHILPSMQDPERPWVVFNGRQSLRSSTHPYPSAPSDAPAYGACEGL